MPRSFQEWVHWIELGTGASWIRRLALALAVVLLSLWICYKQFQGPRTEATLEQAVVGRQLALGRGYTTPINYPQTAALLQKHGGTWDRDFPELHAAPLYPALIGATFALMTDEFRAAMFDLEPEPPNGFYPDYVLLVLNVLLFWIAAWQTYSLGRDLFDRTVGLVAALAVLLSAPLWQDVVSVNGAALSMVVALALMQCCLRLENDAARGARPTLWLTLAGAACGFLFLTDYTGGFAVLPLLAYVWLRFAGERLRALLPALLGFLAVAGTWCAGYTAQVGSPVGLAWQEVALKVEATTFDPAAVKAALATVVPPLSLAKLGNKGLSDLQSVFQTRLWAAGGLVFSAFFVAGLLYRFRQERVNTLRAFFAALLATLLVAHAFLTAGAGDRHPIVWLSPVLMIFGAGFCSVLIASSERLAAAARWILAALMLAQAIPLAQDALEPRRLHFSYPPYYPTLFLGMREEMVKRGGDNPGWMADVPAGAAWYSGQRVWAQPVTLRDFYAIGAEQPMLALVLTPRTLDKPFFSELTRRGDATRLGEWADVYSGLTTGRLPSSFPLSLPQKVSENLYVLIDPLAQPLRKP